jgi:hypothetical protein
MGRLKVNIIPSLWYFLFQFRSRKEIIHANISLTDLDELCESYNNHLKLSNKLYTPKSVDFLNWRYLTNPVIKYKIHATKNWIIIFYIKKHSFFSEFRVVEVIYESRKRVLPQLRNFITKLAVKNRCFIISMTNNNIYKLKIKGRFGPKILINSLKLPMEYRHRVINIDQWNYTLGDLELF